MSIRTDEAVKHGAVSTKNRLRKFLVRSVKVLTAVYFGVLAVLAFAQTHLVMPGGFNHGPHDDQVTTTFDARMVERTGNVDAQYLGLFEPALDGDHKPVVDVASRPTVLYFYGNGSCVRDTVDT